MMYCSLEEAFYTEPSNTVPYNYIGNQDYTSQFQTIQSDFQAPTTTVPTTTKENFEDLYNYTYVPKCIDVEEHYKHCRQCYNKYKQRDNNHHIIIITLVLLLIWSVMSK